MLGDNNEQANPGAAQAEHAGALPMDILAAHFTRLEKEMRASGAHSSIPKFSGEQSGAKFNQWCKDLNRIRVALNADDDRMRFLTLQTLTGQAAEFASSLIRIEPLISWENLKEQLRQRYSDLADVLYGRQRLKRLTQKADENIQNFFQRLVSLAEEVFPATELGQPLLQEQLIEIFVDGIRDGATAKRLLRLRPTNMATALKLALQEQTANRAFQLRRKEEPMECDAISFME